MATDASMAMIMDTITPKTTTTGMAMEITATGMIIPTIITTTTIMTIIIMVTAIIMVTDTGGITRDAARG